MPYNNVNDRDEEVRVYKTWGRRVGITINYNTVFI